MEGVRTMRDAKEIANDIRNLDYWSGELCEELCEAAGMEQEWRESNSDTFESVVYKAAEELGVQID